MTDRERIAWLFRRVGFGLGPGQIDALEPGGVEAAVAALTDPSGAGAPRAEDPWAGMSLDLDPNSRQDRSELVAAWLRAMTSTSRPFEEWMRWFWHGHFVSSMRVVKSPALMVGQLRTFGELGLGDFRTLLRAVTTDPAMLVYLDGRTNKKGAVNENYGRELLELFALGIGNYTEADVRAGAEALTGWGIERGSSRSQFAPAQHDDGPRRYLGRDGVHDVDTVIDAVVAHEACAPFITRKLCAAILGPDVDKSLVERLARGFRDSGLALRPLVQSIIAAGLDGGSRSLVLAPVPWLVAMVRATGIPTDQAMLPIRKLIRATGQVPLFPPNVAGWPGGRAWLTSSSTVTRMNMAIQLAQAVPRTSAVLQSAARGDWDSLADQLGHPAGMDGPTRTALESLRAEKGTQPASLLAVAMGSPRMVMA